MLAQCTQTGVEAAEVFDVELGRELSSELTLGFCSYQFGKQMTSRTLGAFALPNSVCSPHYPALALNRQPDLMDVEVDGGCTPV